MPSHHQTTGNIIALHRGCVRPLETDPRQLNGDHDAAWHKRVNLCDAFAESIQREYLELEPLSFGERLVIFFRQSAAGFAWSFYVLAVLVGMYFAFQLGRGVL